jgi:hypothetical protein
MTRTFPLMVMPPEPAVPLAPGPHIIGFDREQYAFLTRGVPIEVVDAVHTGFGIILSDFDCRQISWSEAADAVR